MPLSKSMREALNGQSSETHLDVETLLAQALKAVHDQGITPAIASASVLTESILLTMDVRARLALARAGLAHLVNAELDAERTRRIMMDIDKEHRRREEELRRRRRESEANVEAQRQAERDFRRIKKDKELQQEVARLHQLTGCVECQGFREQARCLGGPRVAFLPLEDREAAAESRRLVVSKEQSYHQKIQDIHREMYCRNRTCADDFGAMANCVQKYVLSYPENEQQKEIDKWRELNIQAEREEVQFLRGFVDLGKELGYSKAIKNLKSITLMAADGTMKNLLTFDVADLSKWETESATRARGWQERNEWFSRARGLVDQAGVEHIGDLEPEQIEELGDHAERVWKHTDRDGGPTDG